MLRVIHLTPNEVVELLFGDCIYIRDLTKSEIVTCRLVESS